MREKITPALKKFWIVKMRPESNPGCNRTVSGSGNHVYETLEDACKRAASLAHSERRGYVVMEAVRCFDVAHVVEVPVEGDD